MSSAQPGSMPDTNTDVSPDRAGRARPRRSSARARWPGAAAGRRTSTPRWRPASQARDEVGERGVGPGVGGRGVHDRVDVVGEGDARVVGRGHAQRLDERAAHRRRVPTLAGFDTTTPDELEVGVRRHRPDRRSPCVARPPHHHPVRHRRMLRRTRADLLRDLLPPLAPPVAAHEDAQLGVPAVRDLGGVLQVVEAVLALLAVGRVSAQHRVLRRGDAARSTASRRSPWVRDRG